MGKVFESMKQRLAKGQNDPGLRLADSSDHPLVVPGRNVKDHELIAEHYPSDMPYFEVGGNRNSSTTKEKTIEPVTIKIPRELPAEPKKSVSFSHMQEPGIVRPVASQVVVMADPTSRHATEYRNLAEHLLGIMSSQQLRTLAMIPWDQPSLGNQATANLGAAMAQRTRHPILIVDASGDETHDFNSLFRLHHGQGWQEALLGVPLNHLIRQSGHAWLDIIGNGHKLAACTPGVWAQKVQPILASVEQHYRGIIVAGPAFQHSPIALVLSESTDAACLVISQDQLHGEVEAQFTETLRQHQCRVIGSIVMERDLGIERKAG